MPSGIKGQKISKAIHFWDFLTFDTWRQWLIFLERLSSVLSEMFRCTFSDISLSTKYYTQNKYLVSAKTKVTVFTLSMSFSQIFFMILSHMNLSKSRSKSKWFRFFAWTWSRIRIQKYFKKREKRYVYLTTMIDFFSTIFGHVSILLSQEFARN